MPCALLSRVSVAKITTLKALMYQSYPAIRAEHPKHRFIFLTLTIKNPHITELRSTLKHMNESWKRLINRKEFMAVCDGWIRTTEVARPKLPRENKNQKLFIVQKLKILMLIHIFILF